MSALLRNVALVSDTPSVGFGDVSAVAAALQKQASRDFGPIWNVNATVSAFDQLENVPVDYWPVIIRDDIEEPGAAGYHTDDQGQPFALVQADSSWPLTASHETLEMLADPFGNRTVAGKPPAQAKGAVGKLQRVIYLVEVCDPCEAESFAYSVNNVTLSDFITPHYYDPLANPGVRYSFQGAIQHPHEVLDGGYVSFGNPANNEWYQIVVVNGKVQLRDLGKITASQGSLREMVDARVRDVRKDEYYRTKRPAALAAAAGVMAPGTVELSTYRASTLRQLIQKL
jgi:hypothetical protein